MLATNAYRRRLPLMTRIPRVTTAAVNQPIVTGIIVAGTRRVPLGAGALWVRVPGTAAIVPPTSRCLPAPLTPASRTRQWSSWPVWLRPLRVTPSVASVPVSSIRLRATAYGTIVLTGGQAMSVTSSMNLFRGEDKNLDFQMLPAVDVTGWSLTFTLKDTLAGTTQCTKIASILDGPRGRFRVTIASADTASLAVGRYVWDCRRTDAGNKTTVADGTLDLRQEITA